MLFITDLDELTNVIFVGEPSGSAPNQYGDSVPIELPNSGLKVYVASRYWEKSTADDKRLWIEPDSTVLLSSEEYFQQRDPVLEAIADLP